MSAPLITPDAIRDTHARIQPYIRRTPVLEINAAELGQFFRQHQRQRNSQRIIADIQTIAEGIEDIETQDLMQALGLDSAQGFLFARPLPAAAVKVWLDTWQHS